MRKGKTVQTVFTQSIAMSSNQAGPDLSMGVEWWFENRGLLLKWALGKGLDKQRGAQLPRTDVPVKCTCSKQEPSSADSADSRESLSQGQ